VQLIESINEKKLEPVKVLDDFYSFLSTYKRQKVSKIGYSNGAIRTYIIIAKEFLNLNGVKIYNEEMRQRLRLPKRDDVYEEGYSKALINRVVRASNLKLATAILMKCSSGLRTEELVQLRLTDIDFTTNPTTIKVRKETTKTNQTRFTQITTEATNSLKDYLARTFSWPEKTKPDKYILLQTHQERIQKFKHTLQDKKIRPVHKNILEKLIKKLELELKELSKEELHYKSVNSAKTNLKEMLRNTIKEIPDLNTKLENDRNVIHFHGFRSWFKTQVTDEHQSDFAEALMGHKSIRLIYYRQNHEKRLRTYLNVEHALTIADTEKVEKNLSQQQERVQELTDVIKDMNQQHKQDIRQIREELANVINGIKKV